MCTCRCQPLGTPLDVHGVVEIARRFAVNRHDGQIAEIAAARAIGLADRPGHSARLLEHLRRETCAAGDACGS